MWGHSKYTAWVPFSTATSCMGMQSYAYKLYRAACTGTAAAACCSTTSYLLQQQVCLPEWDGTAMLC
jgi:hypothetical protein